MINKKELERLGWDMIGKVRATPGFQKLDVNESAELQKVIIESLREIWEKLPK